MDIHYIYAFIGISTLALNLIFTLHIIKKTGADHKETCEYNDVITFKLKRSGSAEGVTTEAAPYDDTVPLQ